MAPGKSSASATTISPGPGGSWNATASEDRPLIISGLSASGADHNQERAGKSLDVGGVAGRVDYGEGTVDGVGQDVEECARADGPEDDAGAVFVGFDTEIDS